jgi:hypothetical protein
LSPIRILASVLSLLNGVWAVYIHYYGQATATLSAPAGYSVPTIWVAVVGGMLIVDSLVSFAGVRIGFALGAALSAVLLARVALEWSGYVVADVGASAAISAICIVLDLVAFRPAKGLSEKDSPLNLPVFG